MPRPPLLTTLLAALAAAGCATEDTEMCLVVDAEAACPSADAVDPDALYHEAECDLVAVRVLGEPERREAPAWSPDTGGGDDDVCCYPVRARDPSPGSECMVGRPFHVDGEARVAPTVDRSDWAAVEAAGPPDPVRARAWLRLAAMEHASVAAFARLTLDLLALGAPPDLVEDVQRAAADEVAHARLCYGQASRHAGRPLGPGPLDVSGDRPAPDLLTLAAEAAAEGCVGETVGAALAAAAAERATDPAARAALTRIATDEARHAALSWRVVAWAVRSGGPAVRAAVRAALRAPAVGGPAVESDEAALADHGLLGPTAHAAIVRDCLERVVAPAARVLLAA